MELNIALLELLSWGFKNNFTILQIDYASNTGLIELEDGTPRSIHYSEEKKEWI